MRTDDLIAALSAGVEPVRPARLDLRLVALAGALSALGVLILLGARPDLSVAMQGAAFWLKAAYTVALAAAGGWLLVRLGRPGASARAPALAFCAIVALAAVIGLTETLLTAPDARMSGWLGATWRYCAGNIFKASILAAPVIFLAARRFAPTRPSLAGGAAGLLTGAVAATAYGLHCPEATAAFVATWYTLGVAIIGGVGALIGRYAWRW